MSRLSERKIVLIYRDTRLDELIARHNTREQVRFYLESRGQSFAVYDEEHQRMKSAISQVSSALSVLGRVQLLERHFLPNFLFGPDDIPVVVGQDGLVANVLKYLTGQGVVAINPLPDIFDGRLLPFSVQECGTVVKEILLAANVTTRRITMAEATLDDGQCLLAVNDFYIGPRLPVSARYQIDINGRSETQSSSGVIVSTGMGMSGWMSSLIAGAEGISGQPSVDMDLQWESDELVFGVREPFRSKSTSADIVFGRISSDSELSLASHMPEGGLIFSDGIIDDAIEFNAGSRVHVRVAKVAGCLIG